MPSISTTQHKGSFVKGGGNPTLMGENLKTDHGCNAYEDIDWALKTNGRSIAKNMPLLSEYANYGDRETDDTRWPMTLYNRPISLGVDYFVNNLEDRQSSKIDVEAGVRLKRTAKSKIGGNEKAFFNGRIVRPDRL